MTTSVNLGTPLPVLVGLVFTRFADELGARPGTGGLRQSHLRVLDALGETGMRASDLARTLRMTKQGAGQLVAGLVERDLVEQAPDPSDGRARVLVLTAEGTVLRRRVRREIARIEAAWAAEVGPEDYATFRRVLEQVAAGTGVDPDAS